MATERHYRKLVKTQKRVKRRITREMKTYVDKVSKLIEADLIESGFGLEVEEITINSKQFEFLPNAQQDLINATLFFNNFIVDYLLENENTMVIEGADEIADTINYDISFDIVNRQAQKYIDFKRGFLRDTVVNTNNNAILNIISKALIDGTSPQEVGQLIRKSTVVGDFSPARAEMIAVNEMGNAFEFGRRSTVQDFRINTGNEIEKHRDTVNDDKVTEQCLNNQSQGRITFIADFASGDQTAPRASNPRCRCTVNFRRQGSEDL